MRRRALLRSWLLLLLLSAGWLLLPPAAHAQSVTCSATASNVNFGNIDPSQATNNDSNGSVSFACQNQSFYRVYVTACLNIGAGNSASGNTLPRDMDGSAPPSLHFQLYTDAARTQIWGSVLTAPTPSPLQVQFTINAFGSYNSTGYPIYGRVPGSQTGVATGTYQNSFSATNAGLSGLVGTSGYPSGCGTSVAIPFPFTATATVQPTCTVSATDLNFGNVIDLLSGSNHDGTTTITTQCVNGTAYKIGLNNGLHASGNTRRMAGPGGQLIQYELYSDSGRTQRWGNTPGTDTVNKTGNGSNQNSTVYGRVPVQVTPSAGAYSDTVTVTVTY